MTQTLNISLPKELVKEVDRFAKRNYASRSDYIRQALVKSIRAEQSDPWLELAAQADEFDVHLKAKKITDDDIVRLTREARREIYAEKVAASHGTR